jgi:hypothetical protein
MDSQTQRLAYFHEHHLPVPAADVERSNKLLEVCDSMLGVNGELTADNNAMIISKGQLRAELAK